MKIIEDKMQNKIVHAAERQAFKTVLDTFIKKGQNEDVSELAKSLIDLVEKIMKTQWGDEAFATLRQISDQPDGKWAHYVNRLIKETDPKVLSSFLLNAAYEGGFRGFRTAEEASKKYNCNIPWIVLMDPTSACNMHCTGCWAAEYGHKQNLSFEVMDKVLTEGKELGIHACLFTGGEPLVRKKDIIRLCEKHQDVAFHAFTNGTLIDDDFCKDLLRVGNFFVSISVEGFKEANDGRRGNGHFEAAMHAMDLLHSYKIPVGVSICYTSKNYLDVTSDEFLDMLIQKGVFFAWYFHYMPVGMNATTDLLLTPEQRIYMKNKIREIRGVTGGKRYCHINAAGDVEPCVFIHYSGANINEKSLLECLQQPLFLKYHEGQPFNHNHLRPCPMLENPEILQQIIKETGARSTDLEAPESAEHLCSKCVEYAKKWAPVADQVWAETHN